MSDDPPTTVATEATGNTTEVVTLPEGEPNPFEVLGLDVSDARTLTIDDFMVLPTATVKWNALEPNQRKAYEMLGFDASGHKHNEIRSMKVLEGTSETHWTDLTEEQRGAAIELGCDKNGIRHEMGRLATIANRLLLKDPEIKKKKWAVLSPAQRAAATMLGHDNGGSIWNVRVEREWCENGVSPDSSLQNPFALPKGPESLLRIARNMGIEIVGSANPEDAAATPRLKELCIDTDADIVVSTSFVPMPGAVAVDETANNDAETTRTYGPVAVNVSATADLRFDPSGMPLSTVVDKCTKLEITVTEPGTIGMRWDDAENGIISGVTEGLPAQLLGVRPGFQVIAVQGEWVEPVEAFDVLMSHVTERPFTVKFKVSSTE